MKKQHKTIKFCAFLVTALWAFSCRSPKKFFDENTEFEAFSYPTKNAEKPYSLKTENPQTQTVVINFFAPDCPPCITELPELEKFRTGLKGNAVSFVSIGSNLRAVQVDESTPDEEVMKKELAAFIKQHKVSGKIYFAGAQALGNFGVTGFPETFIFKRSKNGKFVLQKKMISAVKEKELTEAISYGNNPSY